MSSDMYLVLPLTHPSLLFTGLNLGLRYETMSIQNFPPASEETILSATEKIFVELSEIAT